MEELNSLLKTLEDLENRVTHSSEEQKEKKDDFSIKIKYVNTSDNEDPNWAKEGDSGFDLRACLPKGETHMVLKPLERALIPTGLYFELPKNYELQVRPRSGHSFKTGLMAILGTVDCFSKDMSIKTVEGDKKISDLRIGDTIFSFNVNTQSIEKDTITKIINTGVQDVLKIYTEDGVLEVTENTEVFTNNGYKLACNLNQDDLLLSF
jgi:dUTP pyrophosphatase